MSALIFSGLVTLFLFITFGTFIVKVVKIPAGFTEKVLIGLVVSNTLTTCLSLFFSISYYILLLFVAGCSVLFFFMRKEMKNLGLLLFENKNVLFLALPFIVIAMMISLNSPMNYDTGLYHLQSIKWIEKFSVVPGLANLHGRFGFNPNIFTLSALCSFFDFFGQEIFSINFTIFSVLVLYFINKLYLIFTRQGMNNLFVFNLLIFITLIDLSDDLTSPAPDFISTALTLFVFSILEKFQDQGKSIRMQSYLSILIFSVYAVTVKLAVLPILVLAVFIVIKNMPEMRKLVWIIPLLTLIVLPWLARNVILTGWLVFPFPSIDWFSFDWKVPISDVIAIKEAVTGWARSPDEQCIKAAEMTIYEWFPSWWDRLMMTNKISILASLFFPIAAFIGCLTKKIKLDFHAVAIILTSFLGVIFWFILAPDVRFGKAFIIIAAASPLIYVKFKIHFKSSLRPIIIFPSIIIILFGYFFINNTCYISQLIADKNLNRLLTPQLIQTPSNVNFETYSVGNVKIYVPEEGDQCFNHQIPCANCPPDYTLALRNGTLQSGFRHIPRNRVLK